MSQYAFLVEYETFVVDDDGIYFDSRNRFYEFMVQMIGRNYR